MARRQPDTPPIERMGTTDLMTLASDLGSPPMQIAGILVLDGGGALTPDAVAAAVGERITGIRRFRQRLVRTPPGLGRPYWTDDENFDLDAHFRHVHCPAPGDEEALLSVAADEATRRLPRDRPLWSVTFVTGLASGRHGEKRHGAALVFVLHHVLTDGIGGLAALARVADGMPATEAPGFPRPRPGSGRLLADNLRTHLATLRAVRPALARVRAGLRELRLRDTASAPRSSLNRPTGPRRRFATVHAELAPVRRAARTRGGMLNDAVLAAATGALGGLLRERGEHVHRFVVSMPVSTRSRDIGARLGNHAVSVPVELPADGTTLDRLERIATLTRRRVGTARGASASLVGPLFRLGARLNLLHWFADHQHVLSTSITYLRGPARPLSFLDVPIRDVVPLSTVKGNMTVSFVALSYAGSLTITAVTDPDQVTDLPVLVRALDDELAALVGTAPTGESWPEDTRQAG